MDSKKDSTENLGALHSYRDICEMVALVYEYNGVGGALHAVLDDGNTEDDDIRYCMESSGKHWSTIEMQEESRDGYLALIQDLGESLLGITESEREWLYEMGWGSSR